MLLYMWSHIHKTWHWVGSPNTQMEPEVTLGPEGSMSLNRGSEFSRTCIQALHRHRLPLRWPDNKYEKAAHKVSQANKFRNRLGRVESSLKLSGQLLVATASAPGLGSPAPPERYCHLHSMPSVFHPLLQLKQYSQCSSACHKFLGCVLLENSLPSREFANLALHTEQVRMPVNAKGKIKVVFMKLLANWI